MGGYSPDGCESTDYRGGNRGPGVSEFSEDADDIIQLQQDIESTTAEANVRINKASDTIRTLKERVARQHEDQERLRQGTLAYRQVDPSSHEHLLCCLLHAWDRFVDSCASFVCLFVVRNTCLVTCFQPHRLREWKMWHTHWKGISSTGTIVALRPRFNSVTHVSSVLAPCCPWVGLAWLGWF